MSEIESLPRGWARVAFGDLLADAQNGCGARHGSGTPVVVLRLADVGTDGSIAEDGHRRVGLSDGDASKYSLRVGDLLAFRVNGSRDITGQVICYAGPPGFAYCDHFIRFRVRPEVADPNFVARAFRHGAVRRQVELSMVSSAGQNTVSQGTFRSVELPVPPLKEQRRIVAKLDALQARSARAREALDAVPPLLEKLRQSILAAAFRGDLTKDWRAKNKTVEPATELLERILAERRKKWEESELAKMKAKGKAPTDDKWKARYKEPEPVDPSGLPQLPQGWIWVSVETAGDVLLGRRRAAEEYVAGKEGRVMRPYVRVANVKEDRLELTDVLEMPFNDLELSLYRLLPGDIVLSEGQSPELVGQSAVFEGGFEDLCIQATVHRFRAYETGTSSAFAQLVFLHHLHAGIFMRASSLTTNIAHLTSERLKPLPFPLPPKAEQLQIVRRVREVLGRTKRLDTTASAMLARERSLSASLLAKAFRGELVPQDPNDEAAVAMLAFPDGSNGSAPPVTTMARARKDGRGQAGRPARTGTKADALSNE